MPPLYLIRSQTGKYGTFGTLILNGTTFGCHTAEPPWKDNQKNISCIPAGIYKLWPNLSPTFGKGYLVKNVPGRSHILIHTGNFAGDQALNLRTDTDGCILPGSAIGNLVGQTAVLSSRTAFNRLTNLLGDSEHELHIIDLYQATAE
jgi:hypothetical protein